MYNFNNYKSLSCRHTNLANDSELYLCLVFPKSIFPITVYI